MSRLWVVFIVLSCLMGSAFAQEKKAPAEKKDSKKTKYETVPDGEKLVTMNFPSPTDIRDVIATVALWTGKNVILGSGVPNKKIQILSHGEVTKEEAYQAFLSALHVLDLTTVETGSVIKIMPIRNALKMNLQIYQGEWAPRTDQVITQIVPLKYIDAKKVQTTLRAVFSGKSGQMIAYEPTNTLIISDSGYKVGRILSILELLDVQGRQPQVALVPIKYADAKSISQKINELLRVQTEGKKSSSKRVKVMSLELILGKRLE